MVAAAAAAGLSTVRVSPSSPGHHESLPGTLGSSVGTVKPGQSSPELEPEAARRAPESSPLMMVRPGRPSQGLSLSHGRVSWPGYPSD